MNDKERLVELLRRLSGFCGREFSDIKINLEGGRLKGEVAGILPFAADSWRVAVDGIDALRDEAKAGYAPALRGLQDVAGYAMQCLLEAAQSAGDSVLREAFTLPVGVKPPAVPLLLKPGALENWQQEAIRQAALQGVELTVRKKQNKNRADRRPGDELARKWAEELNALRGPADVAVGGVEVVTFGGMSRPEVIELILGDGWDVGTVDTIMIGRGWRFRNGKAARVWRGWRDAARFLPRPCKETAGLWWKVCLAKLGADIGPKWEHGADVIKAFTPTKQVGGDALRLAVNRRFMRAVETLTQ